MSRKNARHASSKNRKSSNFKAATNNLSQQALMETLEPRLMLSSLDVTGGVLTYTATGGIVNNVVLSTAAVNYVVADTGELITLTANAIAAGWSGSGTNSVTGTTASVTGGLTFGLDDLNDTINVRGNAAVGGSTVVNGGAGDDTILIGNAGTLDNILSSVTVNGDAGGNDTLSVNDSVDLTNNTYLVTSTTVVRNGTTTVNYATIEGLSVSGGEGADTVNIQSTLVTTPTSVNSGEENDTINISSNAPTNTGTLDTIAGTLSVNGGEGANTLIMSNSGDTNGHTNVIITGTTVQNLAGPADNVTITYAATGGTFNGGITVAMGNTIAAAETVTIQGTSTSPTTLNMGSGADTINIQANSGTLAVNTAGGNDTVNVSSNAPTNTGNLNGIVSTLTIDEGSGSNTLVVANPNDTIGHANVIVTGTSIQNLAGPADNVTINYAATGGNFNGGVTITMGNAANAADTVNVQGTSSGPTTITTGTGADIINVQANTGTLAVNTSGGADTVNVSSNAPSNTGNLNGIISTLTIDEGSGSNTLVVANPNDTNGHANVIVTGTSIQNLAGPADNVTINYAATGGNFNGGVTITMGNAANAADTVNVQGTSSGPTTITTGTGADIINVQANTGTLAVNTSGGADTINISSNAPTNTGDLDDIGATVTLDAGAGSNTLTIANPGDSNGHSNVIVSSTSIQNLAGSADNVTINYAATGGTFGGGITITMGNLANASETIRVDSTLASSPMTITTGNGADTMNVRGISSTLAVNALAGNDTVNVSSNAPTNTGNLDGITAALTIDAQAGTNTLIVSDQSDASANTNAIVTSTNIQNMAGAADNVTINYAATGGTFGGGVTVTGSGAGDTITVQSTTTSTTTVNTGAGTDTINIQANAGILAVNTGGANDTINISSNAPTNTGNLDGIAAGVNIDAGAGSNTLVVANPNDADGHANVIITNSSIQNLAGALDNQTINYTATAGTFGGGVTVTMGNAANAPETVLVQSTSSGPTTVNTGTGADIINVQANTGTLAVNTTSGNDTVNVSSNAPTNTGNLDGIAGVLTIDEGTGANTLVVSDQSDASGNTNAIITSTNIQNMAGAADNITINYAATGGTFGGGLTITASNDAVTGDTVTVQSTTASPMVLNTLAGDDTINIQAITGTLDVDAGVGSDTVNVSSNAPTNTGNLSGIVGVLTIDSGTAGGTDVLNVSERGYGGNDIVFIDLADIASTGYGTIESPALSWLVQVDRAGASHDFGGGVSFSGSNNGNTIYVESTYTDEGLRVNSGDGDDAIVISDAASLISGSLEYINGNVIVNSEAGNDTLYVVDNASITPDTAAITDLGGNLTVMSGFAPATISYYDNAAAQGGLQTLNILGSQGGNTITVNATTASTATNLNCGIGSDAVVINGDNLSAANTFTGNTDSDSVTLNITADIGVASVFPVTSLTINGNNPIPPMGATIRDSLTINDSSVTARDLNLNYLGNDNLTVTAGTGGGFAIPIAVNTTETVIYNGGAGNNDTVTVYGTVHNDVITTAPINASSALVFFNGDPFLDNATQVFGTSLPGISGITDPTVAGPDMLLTGLAGDTGGGGGLNVNGGGADGTGTFTQGDRLVVYGNSEADIVDAASTENFFGFGAGVLIPGLGVGNAYDTISATDSRVVVVNAGVGTLVPVYLATSTFNPIASADRETFSSLIINAGQEVMPTDTPTINVADNITATTSATMGIQVNGNNPVADPLRQYDGDRLNIVSPGDINVWSDLLTPPNVIINSTIGGLPSGTMTYSSIESILVTPGNGVVNILGDNNTTTTQVDEYTVVGTNLNTMGFTGTTGLGVGEFVLDINGSDGIAFSGVLFLNISGDMVPASDFATPSTSTASNTLNIQGYADNTPANWGIDVRFRGGASVASDVINYTGVDGVDDAVTVAPSGVGTGQIIVPNVVTIDYVLTEDLTVTGNSGLAGDTDTLTVNGTSGVDNIGLALTAAGTGLAPWVSITDGLLNQIIKIDQFANFDDISINALDGADNLIVDSAAGASGIWILYDGGPGYDILTLQGGTATDNVYSLGTDAGSGSIAITIGGTQQMVIFKNIEPVIDTVAGPLTVTATNADNAITYTQGSDGTYGVVAVDAYESVEFRNKTTLTIDAMGGTDHVSLDNVSTTGPTGLTTITVNAGPAGENDQLFITALASLAPAIVDPTGIGAATITSAQANVVGETGFAGITINAPAGFSVTTHGAASTVTYEAGALAGTGTVQVDDLTPIYFTGTPTGIAITNAGALVGDTLVANGNEHDNIFGVTGGVVTVDGQAITTTSIANVVMNGLDSNDTFSVTGVQTYTSIALNGGDSSGLDVANLTGTGAAMTIATNSLTATVTGGGLGSVTLDGIDRLFAGNVAGDITVQGTGGNDVFTVSPTAVGVAHIEREGFLPTIDATTTGTLTLDTLGGTAEVNVDGSAGNDVINVVMGATTTVGVTGFFSLDVTATATSWLEVDGADGNDTINVSGTGGPGLFVDGDEGVDILAVTATTVGTTMVTGNDDGAGLVATPGFDVNYQSINGINVTGAAGSALNIVGTNADDTISQIGNTITVNAQAPVTFSTFDTLNIQTLLGEDTTILNGSATGLTGLNVTSSYGNLVVFQDTGLADPTTVDVTGNNAATITNAQTQPITVSGIYDTVMIMAENSLSVVTPVGADTVTYNINAAGSDDIDVAGLMTLELAGVRVPVAIENTGALAADTLVVNGDTHDNSFVLSSTGVGVDGRIIITTGVSDVALNGLAGDDSFVVIGTESYNSVAISGGEPSASDVAVLLGDGATAVIADMAGPDLAVTGGGLGTVSLVGVESAAINNLAGDITVLGSGGNDEFNVSATAVGVAHIERDGFLPTIDATTTGLLTLDTLGGTASVDVDGSAGDDVIVVGLGATTTVGVAGFFTLSATSDDTSALNVNGQTGDDYISVSGSGGPNLLVNGGSGIDTLAVTPDSVGLTTVTASSDDVGQVATPDFTMDYEAINAIYLGGQAGSELTVNGTNGNDAITQVGNVVSVNDQAPITFDTYETLNLLGLAGNDSYSVDPTGAVGVTAINVVGTGGSDLLTVSGSILSDTINYTPSDAAAGTVNITGFAPVAFTGVGAVAIDGQGGDDLLTVTGTTGDDSVSYTPTTFDGGTVRVNSLVPMTFEGIGMLGGVTIAGNGGADTLIYNGTNNEDFIYVDTAITMSDGFTDYVPVTPTDVTNLMITGQEGDDRFTVTAPQPYDQLILSGGDPSGSDVVYFTGDATDVTVEMKGFGSISGGGLTGTIYMPGIETAYVDNLAGAITVNGSTNNDVITVAPVATNLAGITLAGFDTGVKASTTGTLTIDALGGINQLNVDGTANDDDIVVTGTTITINAVAFDYANVESAEIDSLAGNDDISVTVSDVAISVDGGVPTGTTPSDHLTIDVLGAPTSFEPGPLGDEGVVKATGFEYVSFDNIEGLTISGAGPAIINGTNGDDMITVIARDSSTHAGADGVHDFTSTVNYGLEVLWLNSSAAIINAFSGNDDIDIVATAPNDADWNVAVTVNGGYGQDDTSVKTLFGHDVIYVPGTINSGLLTIDDTAPSTVQLNDMEEFFYGAQGDAVNLSIEATTGNDLIKYTALTEASGNVQINNLLAMQFNGMIAGGSFTIDGLAGTDMLIYTGTSADDVFDVEATTGTIGLSVDGAEYVTVEQTGVENLTIRGLDGDDAFTVNGPTGYGSVKIDGGLPSASDAVIVNGTAAAEDITIDVGAGTVTGTGDLVLLTSVEQVSVNADGGADDVLVTKTYDSAGGGITAVNVDLGDGNDSIVVENLVGSTVRVVGVATGDGDDDVTINGTNNDDSIAAEVSGGRVVVSGLVETVVISESAADSDLLTINGFAGDDSIVANNGVEGLIDVTINGGVGDDYIFGNGTLNGGSGDDRIEIGTGASVVDGGTGTNTVISRGNVNFTLTNTSLVGSGTASLANIQQAELEGGASANSFDIGAFTGKVTMTGRGGSDTVDFSASTVGVTVDMDLLDSTQPVNTAGLRVAFTDVIENFIGSDFNDKLYVDALAVPRSVSMGDPTIADGLVVPPGDQLTVDGRGEFVTINRVVAGQPSADSGTVTAFGYRPVTFSGVEKLATTDTLGTTGFSDSNLPAFAPVVTYRSTVKKPVAVANGNLANLDNAWSDLVTVNESGTGIAAVYLNNGYGTFRTPAYYLTGVKSMKNVKLVDMDADGFLDIVTAGLVGRNVYLSVLYGNGHGTFSSPVLTATGLRGGSSHPMFAIGNMGGTNNVVVSNGARIVGLINPGTRTSFTIGSTTPTGRTKVVDLQLADVNGDDFVDMLAVGYRANKISLWLHPAIAALGAPTSTFMAGVTVNASISPTSLRIGDFNNDGSNDLLVTRGYGRYFNILLNVDNTGVFQPTYQANFARAKIVSSAIADMNGDGKLDIVSAYRDGQGKKYSDYVQVSLGNGNGTFSAPYNYAVGDLEPHQPQAITIGDFNNDGGNDIAVIPMDAKTTFPIGLEILLRNPII